MSPYRTAVLILVCALYVAARMWRLTDSCLWFDEIFSVHAAEHSWSTILGFVSLDLIHPPLFYILLKLWMSVGGDGLFWLRLFPVLWSVLAIFPFIALCRELKVGRWVEVLALFLVAVNGALIKYAQEVRMYAPLMCLSLVSMWLFARYFHRGKSFVPLVFVNVAMVYTHYFGWFVVLSEVVLILWFQRIKWRRGAAMFAVVLAAFLPWLIAVVSAARSGSNIGQNIGWMTRPGFRDLAIFIFDLIEPFYFQASTAEPSSMFRVSVPIVLIAVITGILFFVNWKIKAEDAKARLYFLTVFADLAFGLAFVASWLLPYSIFGTRHLVIVFAPTLILFACCVSDMARPLRAAAVTFVVLFAGYAALTTLSQPPAVYSWCGWSAAAAEARAQGADKLLVTEDLGAYHAWFALGRTGEIEIVRVEGVAGAANDDAYFLPRGFYAVEVRDISGITDPVVWLAFRSNSDEPLAAFEQLGYKRDESFLRSAIIGDIRLVMFAK